MQTEVKIPPHAIKYVGEIRLFVTINEGAQKAEAFVPLDKFLELLAKLEALSETAKQTQE